MHCIVRNLMDFSLQASNSICISQITLTHLIIWYFLLPALQFNFSFYFNFQQILFPSYFLFLETFFLHFSVYQLSHLINYIYFYKFQQITDII